jgi:ribosomal protein S18 acetylase RimI-like enzyme
VVLTADETLDRIERCYDAIPRVNGARVEELGPLVLFLRDGPGWPFYARPRRAATHVDVSDIQAMRERQRALGVPESFEWVDDITPSMRPAALAAGLSVDLAPLMVLDASALPDPTTLTSARVGLLDPDRADFAEAYARSSAVAAVGFADMGTAVGRAGPVERDAAVTAADRADVVRVAQQMRTGPRAQAMAWTDAEGLLATGGLQGADDVREIVGVATLPAARRRGLGAAVSAALARHALDSGADLVFLSAASEDVARVYARIGFHRVGTACLAAPPT